VSVNFLGRFLVQEGVISETELVEATRLQEQCNRRLGELARQKGVMSGEQVGEIFEAQRTLDAPFGEIAVRRKFIDRNSLNSLLFTQKIGCRHLGECLLMLGHLSRDQFATLLDRYQGGQRAHAINIEYLLAGSGENALLCMAWASVEKAFARFAGTLLKIESVGAASGVGEFDTGFCIETDLSGQGHVCLGLALNLSLPVLPPGQAVAGDMPDHGGICAVAGEYFVAGLAQYGLDPSSATVRRTEPAQAALCARDGGALLLASPRGRMGLWLACRDAAGNPCRLRENGD
jgi:hypothetical protein